MKKPQNFYWEIISSERAKEVFKEGKEDVYQIFNDETESLIVDEIDIIQAIEWGNELAIERKI